MFQAIRGQAERDSLEVIRGRMRDINRQIEGDQPQQRDQPQHQEFNERLEMFQIIMQDSSAERRPQLHSSAFDNARVMRLARENQLLNEKLAVQQKTCQKEMEYLCEKHQDQLLLLRTEIEKYQKKEKKATKEEHNVLLVKKENRQLQELYAKQEMVVEQLLQEKTLLKKQMVVLRNKVKEKEEFIVGLQAQRHAESDQQKRLKEELTGIKQERVYESERKKQMELSLSRMRQENDQLTRELDKLKAESEHQRQIIIEKVKGDVMRLEEDNRELKRRNQKLEESFIDHLTQTSLNLQQTFKAPERTKNSSLYLNQTPIKHRSRAKERVHTPQEEDPQKSLTGTKNGETASQMKRLKVKLKQANTVIVELLQEKAKNYRK